MKFNEAKAHAVALFNSAEFKERVNEEDDYAGERYVLHILA